MTYRSTGAGFSPPFRPLNRFQGGPANHLLDHRTPETLRAETAAWGKGRFRWLVRFARNDKNCRPRLWLPNLFQNESRVPQPLLQLFL